MSTIEPQPAAVVEGKSPPRTAGRKSMVNQVMETEAWQHQGC